MVIVIGISILKPRAPFLSPGYIPSLVSSKYRAIGALWETQPCLISPPGDETCAGIVARAFATAAGIPEDRTP